MRKSKYQYRYDDKTGMTVLGASIGYCIVAAVITNVLLAKNLSDDAAAGLMVASGFFVAIDLFVRIAHYRARRRNEQLTTEFNAVRYISLFEKITYWILKIFLPVYLIVLLVTATVLGL